MGCKLWLCVSVAVLFGAYSLSSLIELGLFAPKYNHLPGKCARFNMSGSEDLVLYPNNHVLISSGIFFYELLNEKKDKPQPGIFLLDMSLESPQPENLTFEGFPESEIPSEFSPHGMGHWITNNGSLLLYFVNHRRNKDTVESFEYKPSRKTLVHRRTFEDLRFYNLNDVAVVGIDEFYVTVDRYFQHHALKEVENNFRLPLGSVLYCNGNKVLSAWDTLRYPNGIARSNDGRFIFVSESLGGRIGAYTRNKDNTLTQVQVLPLQVATDNIVVDPVTGHLWVGIIAEALQMGKYFYDRDVHVASKILHVSINPKSVLPFSNYLLEEVFSSSGFDGVVSAVSSGLYVEAEGRGRLVVGTVGKDMMLCDVHYLMY